MTNCNDKIAEAAYYIWQSQGCPNGMSEQHWNLAVEQLSGSCKKSCSSAKKSCTAKKTSTAKKTTTAKKSSASKK